MTYQTSFTHAEFAAKKKTTRREKFLARIECAPNLIMRPNLGKSG